MKRRYRLVRLTYRGGRFYCFDTQTKTRESLGTKDLTEANRLIDAKNEALRQPALNLEMAKVYLSASDPKFQERTWSTVMNESCKSGKESTRLRKQRAFQNSVFDPTAFAVYGSDFKGQIFPRNAAQCR